MFLLLLSSMVGDGEENERELLSQQYQHGWSFMRISIINY